MSRPTTHPHLELGWGLASSHWLLKPNCTTPMFLLFCQGDKFYIWHQHTSFWNCLFGIIYHYHQLLKSNDINIALLYITLSYHISTTEVFTIYISWYNSGVQLKEYRSLYIQWSKALHYKRAQSFFHKMYTRAHTIPVPLLKSHHL